MGRKLTKNVYVGETLHRAGDEVDDDVAKQITFPGVLEGDDGDYASLTVVELKAEIDRRNKGRDEEDQLSKSGHKDDLVAALQLDDES